jgi:hypothetical protein
VVDVASADRCPVAAVGESLAGVLADRFQHPEALAVVPDEAFVDERLQCVKVGARYLLGCVDGAAAAKDGQAAEESLLLS